jgi:hypothetical protein
MHRILVEEKKWIEEERFLHALNYCMLLPGREAQQLAAYIGWLLHTPDHGHAVRQLPCRFPRGNRIVSTRRRDIGRDPDDLGDIYALLSMDFRGRACGTAARQSRALPGCDGDHGGDRGYYSQPSHVVRNPHALYADPHRRCYWPR